MKKVIFIFVSLVLILCLIGCDEPNESNSQKEQEVKINLKEARDSSILIWTDPETGVQYIIYRDSGGYSGYGGITPRLNADGTLYTEGGE